LEDRPDITCRELIELLYLYLGGEIPEDLTLRIVAAMRPASRRNPRLLGASKDPEVMS
jgi:hypothetical protein